MWLTGSRLSYPLGMQADAGDFAKRALHDAENTVEELQAKLKAAVSGRWVGQLPQRAFGSRAGHVSASRCTGVGKNKCVYKHTTTVCAPLYEKLLISFTVTCLHQVFGDKGEGREFAYPELLHSA